MPPIIADGSQWGALFLARAGEGLDADRQFISEFPFTILDQKSQAGLTRIWAWGTSQQVFDWTADSELQKQLPGLFFNIPVGEEITLLRIKQWAPLEEVAS